MDHSTRKLTKLGFTLTELLVVIAILAILIMIALSMVRGNRDKADDATSKAALNRLKIAFEDYYADNNCYPPAEYFDESTDCNSSNLSPYLNVMPCDKNTGLPYVLETDDTGCSWFKLYASLKASDRDPEALSLCDDSGSSLGNYGVSSDNVRPLVACPVETPIASISPSSSPGASPLPPGSTYYYCSTLGNCTNFNHELFTCTPSYPDNPNCDGGVNKCSTVGSCQPL